MDLQDKKRIQCIILMVFLRYLKENHLYFIVPLKFSYCPTHSYYARFFQTNINYLDSISWKDFLRKIDNNISQQSTLKETEYITKILNVFLNIFLDETELKSSAEICRIGQKLYDKICKIIFGNDYKEAAPNSISDFHDVDELYGFIANEYYLSASENNNDMNFQKYLNQFLAAHKTEIETWANERDISLPWE